MDVRPTANRNTSTILQLAEDFSLSMVLYIYGNGRRQAFLEFPLQWIPHARGTQRVGKLRML